MQRLSAVDRGSFSIFAPTFLMYDHVDIAEGAIFCDFSMCTVNMKIGRHFHGNVYCQFFGFKPQSSDGKRL